MYKRNNKIDIAFYVTIFLVLSVLLTGCSKTRIQDDSNKFEVSDPKVTIAVDEESSIINTIDIAVNNVVGNTTANITSGGIAAIQGEWIYYSFNNQNIYKIKQDGSKPVKICDSDDVYYINAIDDWIYYLSVVDNYSTYKMKADGSEKTKIEGNIMDGAIQLLNGEIFYIDDWQ